MNVHSAAICLLGVAASTGCIGEMSRADESEGPVRSVAQRSRGKARRAMRADPTSGSS
jgi:hypothetical protein